MLNEYLEAAPIGRGKLRPLVDELSAQMAALSAETPGAAATLIASWERFVKAIDLGDAPHTRSCPTCGRTVMAVALRCDGCWAHLTPEPGAIAAA